MGLNIIGIVALIVSSVALLFAILALALPLWELAEVSGVEAYAGLWKSCLSHGGTVVCGDITSDSTSDEVARNHKAVRAMVFLGVLLLVGTIAAGVVVLFVMNKQKMLYFVAGGLGIAAELFLMIGFAVYDSKIHGSGIDYGAAFALDIVAWILAWVSGGLFIASKMRDKSDM